MINQSNNNRDFTIQPVKRDMQALLVIALTSSWEQWRLKSPASRRFAQLFVQAQIKETVKHSASLAFVRRIRGWPVISPHKGPVTRKMLPFDDIMKSAERVTSTIKVNKKIYVDATTSLALGLFGWYFGEKANVNNWWGISRDVIHRWLSLDFYDDKSTLVQVMTRCCQVTSHYPKQYWPIFSLYGVTGPRWVNLLVRLVIRTMVSA